MKKLEELSFDELTDQATFGIFNGLIEGGTKQMKSQIWLWMSTVIRWSDGQNKIKAKGIKS